MSSAIAAILAASIASILYRRQQGKPATALSDGSGHLLLHARWEKAIAWLVLAVAAVQAALVLYVLGGVRARPATRTIVLLLFSSGFFAALGLWCFRSARRHIRVNDCGVTLYRGTSAVEIAWANVTAVTTDLMGALVICSSTGAQIAVNKMLVGIPTLVAYMRRHLPARMYSGAFGYYTPRAHLGPLA